MTQEMIRFLNEYQGNSNFVLSLRDQYRRWGNLSVRQMECLAKMLEPKVYSVKIGEKLIVGKGTATRISQSLGVDFVHRGFEVKAIHAETERAILVDVRFSATRTVNCCVCGIQLKTQISRSIGIGPVCAEKHGIPYEINSLNLLQAKLDAVETVAHKVWIPKSQIKEKEEA